MPDLIQSAFWPGIAGVLSCQGTIGHGISPSTFVLTTVPQVAVAPAAFGDLMISDGSRSVGIRGARLARTTGRTGPDGQYVILEIEDRRWRWRSVYGGFGAIDGQYNNLDTNKKLIPWQIRSPYELAKLCFDALAEPNNVIDLPKGLSRSDGADLYRYLTEGENFAQSFANPPVDWTRTPPAEALARLCDYFGRRVVYQPQADRFLVTPLGVGSPLPGGYLEVDSPGVTIPVIPAGVGVAGAPVRFQTRFLLEAVGKEWDGKFVPINQLTYAPKVTGKVQITTITYVGSQDPAVDPLNPINLKFSWTGLSGGQKYLNVTATGGGFDDAPLLVRWARIQLQIASNPSLASLVKASFSGTAMTLIGLQPGQQFTADLWMSFKGSSGSVPFETVVTQAPSAATRAWGACQPPEFAGVTPTDRLAYLEAQQLARQYVFRAYRIRNIDPGDPEQSNPLQIPWFGTIKRRQQVILQQTKVEQVIPQDRIPGGKDRGAPVAQGILPEFYNGYSRYLYSGST
ncbi:MAG: hypothetical protein JWO38_414 [Gemmataceae bacterium]|nr:hypothetical protein [Gemmataceae bacterium]